MPIKFTYTLFILAYNASPSAHPYPTFLPSGTGIRLLGVCGYALESGCPKHWTIQPRT